MGNAHAAYRGASPFTVIYLTKKCFCADTFWVNTCVSNEHFRLADHLRRPPRLVEAFSLRVGHSVGRNLVTIEVQIMNLEITAKNNCNRKSQKSQCNA